MPALKIRAKSDRRHDIFLTLIGELNPLTFNQLKLVAKQANVHWCTLYNWRQGETTTPRIDTLAKVAGAFGYEIRLRKDRSFKRSYLRVVK